MAKRVLIADCDQYYRNILFNVFDKINCEIVTVFDGNDAVEFLSLGMFDIAVIDYDLPGKRGDEVICSMRSKYIEIPVIIVTSDNSIETERNVRSQGPAYFFIKPFSVNDMHEVVQRIFKQKEKQYT